MAGVRLHHPTLANCTYVVELDQPFANNLPMMCPTCAVSHAKKSLHLHLDANGDVFVTPGVLETLRGVFLAGLEVLNEVEQPPDISIGAVDQPKMYIVDEKLNKGTILVPQYRPARTKYENGERMNKVFQRLFLKEN